jgi:hypothetical protein
MYCNPPGTEQGWRPSMKQINSCEVGGEHSNTLKPYRRQCWTRIWNDYCLHGGTNVKTWRCTLPPSYSWRPGLDYWSSQFYCIDFLLIRAGTKQAFRIPRVLTMVCNTRNHWVCELYRSSGILNTIKHKVSETWSVSVIRGGERDTYITLRIAESVNFVHRPVFQMLKKKQRFGNWVCFCPQARGGRHQL